MSNFYRKVSVLERNPPLDKFVPTIDEKGEIIIYRLVEQQVWDGKKKKSFPSQFWNMRDMHGDNTPYDNHPITHWLEEVEHEVYDAVDSERKFQDKMTADLTRPDMIEDFHLGDALSAIQYNLRKAEEAWYISAKPHTDAMKYLRKIAALCVKQGEKEGMPKREL